MKNSINSEHENFNTNIINTIKSELVSACRILVQRHLDSWPFGNLSIRIPGYERFIMNPIGKRFDKLEESELVMMDFNGNICMGDHKPHQGEFIHRAIYKSRTDISAIVHTHSESTVLVSLLGCKIQPFTQLGFSIYDDQSLYDDFTGTVTDFNEGQAIANALADKSILIAKNHGLFTTGQSIQAALWDFIIVDEAAKIHLEAQKLGIQPQEHVSMQIVKKSKIKVRAELQSLMWQEFS